MGEVYAGTKFRTRFARRRAPDPDARLADLMRACRRMALAGLAPGGAGNASVRSNDGFVVTRTAADLAAVGPEDLVLVLACDVGRAELLVSGLHEPSSESMLHAGIYGARPDVGAVLHGHADELLARAAGLALPVTERERPYGTAALVAEALAALGAHPFLVIREHGFVALGETPERAWNRIEEVLARLR